MFPSALNYYKESIKTVPITMSAEWKAAEVAAADAKEREVGEPVVLNPFRKM